MQNKISHSIHSQTALFTTSQLTIHNSIIMSVKSFASTCTSRSKVRSNVLTTKSNSSRGNLSSIAAKSNSTGTLPPKGITSTSRAKAKPSVSQYHVAQPTSKAKKHYDPVEDLQRHYLEGDQTAGVKHEESDDDEDAASNEAPGFIQKSMKFEQLNADLEKTSKALFQRIDSYIANKAKKNSQPLEQEADSSMMSTGNEVSFGDHSQFLGSGDLRNDNSDQSSMSSSISSFSSCLTQKAMSASTTSTIPCFNESAPTASDSKYNGKSKDDPVDLKTKQRLQKASESVISCLQSKLHSYEGRIADMNVQYRQKIQENTMLESKIKLLEDDRERLLKSNSNLQTTSEKYAKAAETAKIDLNSKAQALVGAKKEMDFVKKELRIKSTALQNLQTKLNRLSEENDRMKHQTRSTQLSMRDKQQEDRSAIDELHQRVNQLEQQKIILNSTISKQTLLIKALRNQRNSNSNTAQDKPTFY